jgi:filamentous hemagglutinin
VIASNPAAIDGGKNGLSTSTLIARDLRNEADANASGLALSAGSEQLSGGKYEVGKAVAENLAGNARAGSSSTGATRSAVSAGTLVITDDAGQRAATGQRAEEAVAFLNRDTTSSHAAAQRQDVGQLEQQVRVRRAFQQQVVRQAEQFTPAHAPAPKTPGDDDKEKNGSGK